MGGTRFYDFLTGYNQTTAPSGSAPSGGSDFITVDYGSLNYARFVGTVANLKAVAVANRTDQLAIFVKSLEAWFYFDSASAVTGDDQNVITPTAGTGRWLRIPLKGLGQSQDVATAATIAALASSTPVVRLTGSTVTSLQGVTAGVNNQVLTIFNASSAVVTLAHENASASATNRLNLPSSLPLAVAANGAAFFRYDATLLRWVLISSSGSGGGAGGLTIYWNLDSDAPLVSMQNNAMVADFAAGLAQRMIASFKVPNGYQAGSPINLRSVFFSADTSGNVLFQTVATLLRTGTDLVSSTANQRTSTNAALTQSAGTAGKGQAVVNDLTSTLGVIGSAAVAPGDTILVEFKRVTDTATGVASAFYDDSEVTFS